MQFVDENRGWAVGGGGTILFTDDGGRNWIIQDGLEVPYLWSMSFVDTRHGWIASKDNDGAIAQLGERLTGSQEVRGSTPLGSIKITPAKCFRWGFLISKCDGSTASIQHV